MVEEFSMQDLEKMGYFMKCPDCKKSRVIGERGKEFCSNCGLVMSTYSGYPQQKKRQRTKPFIPRPKISKQRVKCIGCGSRENITLHHVIPKHLNRKTKLVALCRAPCHNLADFIALEIYGGEIKFEEHNDG